MLTGWVCLRTCKNVLLLGLIQLVPPMGRCVSVAWFGDYRRCLAVFYSFCSVTTADASLCFIRFVRLLPPMPRCVLFVLFGYYRRCLAVFYSFCSVTTADASLCFLPFITVYPSLCFIRFVRLLRPMPRCVLFVLFGYYRRCLAVFYSFVSVTTADASLCFSWLNELFIAVICSSSGSK